MKWLTYVAALMPVLILLALAFPAVELVTGTVFASVPVVVGIAVLKYRLYDVDLVINRTLVYGSLTVLLAAVYFGGVASLQFLFRAVTGQEEQPQIMVVASTLTIAALFGPLRRRVQGFIDHRFYRKKYDARKTLEDFSARLRDGTDLGGLRGDLVAVTAETVQPEHASLWLAPTPDRRKGRGGDE